MRRAAISVLTLCGVGWLCQDTLAGLRVESIKEKLARGQLNVNVEELFNEDDFEDNDDEVDAELEAFRRRLQL